MDKQNNEKRRFISKVGMSIVVMIAAMVFSALVFTTHLSAQEGEGAAQSEKTITAEEAGVQKFGFMAAAIAFGLGALGAGIAIAHVGSAAMGTLGEKPELAGQALIFIALAEGLVVFGFITALMILGKF
ncbi:MAG: ATP synthase subunit C [Spirochaetaceae bacterium]